jgi:hypothetical protein
MLVPGVVVGVFSHCRNVVDGVEATRGVTSATRELISEDKGVEF